MGVGKNIHSFIVAVVIIYYFPQLLPWRGFVLGPFRPDAHPPAPERRNTGDAHQGSSPTSAILRARGDRDETD